MPARLTDHLDLLAARLEMFSGLLDKVEGQWREAGHSLDDLATTRLAPDMHPLYWQIAAVALQGQLFTTWCRGGDLANSVPELSGWEEARVRLRAAQEEIEGARDIAEMPPAKRIVIGMIGMYLDLSGQRYLDEWILPNLYFHMTTAYAIMRMKGAQIGKADFMASLMGELKPLAEGEHS